MSSELVHHVGYSDSLSVTISISLTYTLLILGLRLYIRNESWGVDDICVSFATVRLSFSHCVITILTLATM